MMTTEAKVRELSGFDDTTNITSATVLGKISIAESMVNSAVGRRYALPIAFHRSNTLTFDGTGSGSGTMTIVVNGTNYDITISSGLTAARAAELFRLAAVNSSDFVVRLNGAEATIISKTATDGTTDIGTADDEVNITAAPTTSGISATIGTRGDRYTPVLHEMASEIAAALLLKDNYGPEAEDTPKDGEARLAAIRDQLSYIQAINENELQLDLYDEVTGLPFESGTQDSPEFHPDDTSFSDSDNPTAPKIGINQIF
jgi:phage tail sheath gpL-like